MRRLLCLLCCLMFLLTPGVRAVEEKPPIALTFEEDFTPLELRELLAGLDRRGARATFFLDAAALEKNSALGTQIANRSHETGVLITCRREGALLSRREIAGQINALQSGLPKGCRIRFWRSRDPVTDGARQVAGALGLVPGEWTLDPSAAQAAPVRDTGFMGRVRAGDILRISGRSIPAVLNMVDLLQQKFTLVTMAELARSRVASR